MGATGLKQQNKTRLRRRLLNTASRTKGRIAADEPTGSLTVVGALKIKPPKGLQSEQARELWVEVYQELKEFGLLARIDRHSMMLWANLMDDYYCTIEARCKASITMINQLRLLGGCLGLDPLSREQIRLAKADDGKPKHTGSTEHKHKRGPKPASELNQAPSKTAAHYFED